MRMSNFLPIASLAALLLQIGCSSESQTTPAAASKPVPVHIVKAQYQSVPAIVDAPGTVQPRNRIALSSQINGFVREMRVRAGDAVRQGQILATLDSRDAESQKAMSQAAIDEAQAALAEARKANQAAVETRAAARASTLLASETLNRYQKLFDAHSVSPQELDEVRARRDASAAELSAQTAMAAASEDHIRQIEARIAQARAQSGRADVMMSWTEIKAPAAGIVVERSVDTGSAVFPGTPLLVLESTARPQVLADLPTERAGSLHTGMDVRLGSSPASAPINGRVAEIVPLSNPSTHTVQFKVDLPAGFSLPVGHFMEVEIQVGTRSALLVPRRSVREVGQLTGVFVADGSSKARFRLVKAAPFNAGQVELLSGIEPGESIIADPSEQLTDGVTVEIRP